MLLCRQHAVPGVYVAGDDEDSVDGPAHRKDYHYGQPGVVYAETREHPDYTHTADTDERSESRDFPRPLMAPDRLSISTFSVSA